MANNKVKKIAIDFALDEIIGMEISKSGDYKYARVGVKKGENERLSVYYEWVGAGIPDFVVNLMSYVQANKGDVDVSLEANKEEYASLTSRSKE